MDYKQMARYARALGYDGFTSLQETVFCEPRCYNPAQGLLIVGETSSGKTLIPLLLYYAQVEEALRCRRAIPKMLFVTPYRALTAQKCIEISKQLQILMKTASRLSNTKSLQVVQSTGEYRLDDIRIKEGLIDVAVIITEKVFLFSCEDLNFLRQYDFIVLDEIGLIANESRGSKLDLLLTWCYRLHKQGASNRVITLGTPFYDWSEYARCYDLCLIQKGGRPALRVQPIYCPSNSKIVEFPSGGQDAALPRKCMISRIEENGDREGNVSSCILAGENARCVLDTPCRRVENLGICERIGGVCQLPVALLAKGLPRKSWIISQICRWHLNRGEQVLIFWNNREEVRNLAKYLLNLLDDILPPAPSPMECKKLVLEGDGKDDPGCGITEDELFGILDEEHYTALTRGIGFHSSSVPNELRTYIERQFLNKRKLQIVCSTETLAYGINSAVEAVVIADMKKMVAGQSCELTVNEYQNYIGRAGRLQPGLRQEEITGYVYPLLNFANPEGRNFQTDEKSEYATWKKINDKTQKPELMYSRIFDHSNSYIPFLLLTILPDTAEQAMPVSEMQRLLAQLPQNPDAEQESTPFDLENALQFLLKYKLIAPTDDLSQLLTLPSRRRDGYYVSMWGTKLRGYTPSCRDYEVILHAVENMFWYADYQDSLLIYHLLDAPCLANDLYAFHLIDSNKRFAEQEIEQTIRAVPLQGRMEPVLEIADPTNGKDRWRLAATAAVLCWADSMTSKEIYIKFKVTYPHVQALAQQLAYLMEIVQCSTHHMPRHYHEPEDEYQQRQAAMITEVHSLATSVYYGVQRELYRRLLTFFKQQSATDPGAEHIFEELNNPQPSMARQLRQISIYFKFFLDGSANQHTKEAAKTKAQYYKEIQKLGKLWWMFFKENCWNPSSENV